MPQVRLDYRTPYGVKDKRLLKDFYQQNKSGRVSLHFKVKIPIQANSPLVILIKKQKGRSRLAGGSNDDVSGELNNKLGVLFSTLVYIHQMEIVFTHTQTQTHTWIFEVETEIFIYFTMHVNVREV